MHNELILPVPVLMIHQGRITPAEQQHNIVLQIILKDLGYPEELVLSAHSTEQAQSIIYEHLPNLIFYYIQDSRDLPFIQKIKTLYPASYLVTLHENAAKTNEIIEAIQLGADAYLLTDAPAEQQFQHVKCILSGGALLHPQLAQHLQTQFKDGAAGLQQTIFSHSEAQIIQHISQSQSAKETAEVIQVSEYQVYTLIKNIFRKLTRLYKQKKGS
ncbi:response regulator transcription factor [Acinetobacter sp. ANC 3813]|uniref:response regulator transcription factor n=1 Tax=Acinetobacter sp. ANC 3813 TaxID=1977873 RepID=UPI000A344B5D|nr:response regulator transcription factor [Acinetobacter sp. ANC 3813]OTG90345.1 hypothetical protein B9T34_07485 [Acinetobacter sp. ANC 3813]